MNELRLAVRRLRRRPGRSLVGVATLALGIGASTAAFSAVEAVLLAPHPVHAQDELVVVWRQNPTRDFAHVPFTPSGAELVREGVTALAGSAAFDIVASAAVADGGDVPVQVTYRRVTGSFFDVLGATPAAGRLLEPADDVYGAEPVAVLGHGFWVTETGADPSVIGSSMSLRGSSYRVVGVAQPGFDFPRGTELWITLRGSGPPPAEGRPGAELDVVARLGPGATTVDALAQIDALFAADPDQAEIARPLELVATPFAEHVVGSFEPVLEAGMGVTVLLLLVAVANAALLFLSGGARSLQEVAARRALGASRPRVIAPLLADAALLAALGAIAGAALASGLLRLLLPLAPAELPRLDELALDAGSLAFAAAVAVLAMLGSGGVAGWWLSRQAPGVGLASVGRGPGLGGEGLRRAIATAQIAFAVVAAVGAGLLVRTVGNLDGLDRGFTPESLYLVGLGHGHPIFEVPEAFPQELEALASELAGRPEIVDATPTLNRPLDFNAGVELSPTLEGQGLQDALDRPYVTLDAVLPNYFEVMGIAVATGRTFSALDDGRSERVVVVNEAAARLLWPGRSPLGQRLNVYPGEPDALGTVIGVVEDSRYRSYLELRPAVWVPLHQYASIPPNILVVRTAPGAGPLRPLVVEALAETAPYIRALTVDGLDEVMQRPLALPRFAAAVLLTCALITLLLAGLGVYGVFSVLVQERRGELGLRRALGARNRHLLRFIAVRVLTIGVAGMGLGALASAWLSASIESLLYGVDPVDPVTLVGVLIATLSTALLAAGAPAVSALRTDPARALRTD